MRRNDLAAQVARHRLHARLNGAVAGLPEQPATPTYVVDLDASVLALDGAEFHGGLKKGLGSRVWGLVRSRNQTSMPLL